MLETIEDQDREIEELAGEIETLEIITNSLLTVAQFLLRRSNSPENIVGRLEHMQDILNAKLIKENNEQ